MQKKKIVVVGGGNGSGVSINALKTLTDEVDISAVIAMSDSGGSSGRLRKELDTLPSGDIMRAALALSEHDSVMLKKIFFRNRFHDAGALDGHNLGNLFLVLAEQYAGNFLHALAALHQAVDAVGTAYPATLEQSDMCAELTNGDTVTGEDAIDRPTYDRSIKIKRAWLTPAPRIYPPAARVIEQADYIVFGPGSLYTSVVAVLAVSGMAEALRASRAQYIFIAGNAYEMKGETGPETLSGFVTELEAYLPRAVDMVVYNSHMLTEQSQKKYAEKQWGLFAYDPERISGRRIASGDFEKEGGGLSAERLGKILKDILDEKN